MYAITGPGRFPWLQRILSSPFCMPLPIGMSARRNVRKSDFGLLGFRISAFGFHPHFPAPSAKKMQKSGPLRKPLTTLFPPTCAILAQCRDCQPLTRWRWSRRDHAIPCRRVPASPELRHLVRTRSAAQFSPRQVLRYSKRITLFTTVVCNISIQPP